MPEPLTKCEASAASRLATLNSQLVAHVAHFDTESAKHKRLYRTLRISTMFLLAASTALAGTAATFSDYAQYGNVGKVLNLIIVAVTATAGMLTSIEGMRKPAELWVLERRTYHALTSLKEELDFQTAGGERTIDLDDYFKRMRDIISEYQQRWPPAQAKPSDKSGPSAST